MRSARGGTEIKQKERGKRKRGRKVESKQIQSNPSPDPIKTMTSNFRTFLRFPILLLTLQFISHFHVFVISLSSRSAMAAKQLTLKCKCDFLEVFVHLKTVHLANLNNCFFNTFFFQNCPNLPRS